MGFLSCTVHFTPHLPVQSRIRECPTPVSEGVPDVAPVRRYTIRCICHAGPAVGGKGCEVKMPGRATLEYSVGEAVKRILLIEDYHDTRVMLAQWLTALGYAITAV